MSLTPSPCDEGVATDRRAAAKRARDDEANLVLLEHVARAIANARLGACVRRPPEAERVLVVVGGLLRVPHPQLDVVPAVQRHEVVSHVTSESIPAVAGVPAAASTPRPVKFGQSPGGSGTGRRERSTSTALRIATPPTTSHRVRCSPRSSEREEDAEERLHVREERRPRRADAADRGEPQDVRQEQRADHREREADPHQVPKWKLWLVVWREPASASGIQPNAAARAS